MHCEAPQRYIQQMQENNDTVHDNQARAAIATIVRLGLLNGRGLSPQRRARLAVAIGDRQLLRLCFPPAVRAPLAGHGTPDIHPATVMQRVDVLLHAHDDARGEQRLRVVRRLLTVLHGRAPWVVIHVRFTIVSMVVVNYLPWFRLGNRHHGLRLYLTGVPGLPGMNIPGDHRYTARLPFPFLIIGCTMYSGWPWVLPEE